MKDQRASHQTPEERELEKKRADLGALEVELAQRELELATLRAELQSLEARYFHFVGRLYVELDDLQAQLAEARARHDSQNSVLRREASEARTRAAESAEAVAIAGTEEANFRDFAPADELKRLYREVAKLLHPDLATDEGERVRRT